MSDPKQLNTPKGAYTVFFIYYDVMKRFGFDLKGKTVLNIGAGNLIGLDVLFLFFGAKQVISVDLNPGNYRYPEISDQLFFFEAMWEILKENRIERSLLPWDDIIHTTQQGTFYNTDRLIRLSPGDASYLPLKDGCVDFTLSNAVLEHIRNPEKAIEEIARTLAKAGHTMHRVDLRDHADFSRPYEFLKPGKPINGCNLWRTFEFEAAFKKEKLDILDFEVFDTDIVTAEERSTFRLKFSNLPLKELEKLRFMVYARKT
jgi:SAM-dependent methyltransferase